MKYSIAFLSLISLALGLASCNDTESYSNLLRAEEKATNWWMSDKKICLEIPKDSVFETGEDAPYYKMDEDGYLYMQVINPGTGEIPKENAKVYFRYMRMNIKYLYKYDTETWEGNANDMDLAATYFYYHNYYLTYSQLYGSGIQTPISYLGYNCEVNLVLRSYYGFSTDASTCLPYAMNIKYYKAEY